jgi:hypothetical protein
MEEETMRRAIRIVTDDDDVVQDGQSVHGVYLTDAVRYADGDFNRPHFLRLDDDVSRALRKSVSDARAEMLEASRNAWDARAKKRPEPARDPDEDPDEDEGNEAANPRDAARAEYGRMCQRLRDSWRNPPAQRDAAEPDNSSGPDMMRRHLHGAEPDVVAIKEKAYQDYTANLSEAWKRPPGITSPAPAILGIGPANKVVEPDRPAGARTDPSAAASIERLRERTHGGK